MQRVVIDTNVLVGALFGSGSADRDVFRACFENRLHPLVGEPLFLEYEDVLGRPALFRQSLLTAAERSEFFSAFMSVTEWVKVYFSWRPNLVDEGDNHLMELAVAGGARYIVTHNRRDFVRSELRFPEVLVVTPGTLLKELR